MYLGAIPTGKHTCDSCYEAKSIGYRTCAKTIPVAKRELRNACFNKVDQALQICRKDCVDTKSSGKVAVATIVGVAAGVLLAKSFMD